MSGFQAPPGSTGEYVPHEVFSSGRRKPKGQHGLPGTPRARTSDPVTSHLAALGVEQDLRRKQEHVLSMFLTHGRMTDEDLAKRYEATTLPQQSPSGLRTRRHELVLAGLVRDSGFKDQLDSTSLGIMWELVPDRETHEALRRTLPLDVRQEHTARLDRMTIREVDGCIALAPADYQWLRSLARTAIANGLS